MTPPLLWLQLAAIAVAQQQQQQQGVLGLKAYRPAPGALLVLCSVA
jgi:hypothetical protein